MPEFCPICYKNGQKRKVHLLQINLEEAVWLCEYSKCLWPFGYEDFTFVSRKIGEKWSAEWEIGKPPQQKSSKSVQISLSELGLDTPPVTPGSGTELMQKDSVFGDNTCSLSSPNLNTNNIIETKANGSSHEPKHSNASKCASVDNESTETRLSGKNSTNTKSNDRDLESQELSNRLHPGFRNEETGPECKGSFSLDSNADSESSDKRCSSSREFIDACDVAEALNPSIFDVGKSSEENLTIHELKVECKKRSSDNTKSTVLGNESSLSESETSQILSKALDVKPRFNSTENLNLTKKLPEIKSIKKTNVKLVIPPVKLSEKNSPALAKVEKISSSAAVEELTENVIEEIEQKTENSNSSQSTINSDDSVQLTISNSARSFRSENSRIENKTLVIDGLLPIQVSYEVPNFLEESLPVPLDTICRDKEKLEDVKVDVKQEPGIFGSVVGVEVGDRLESKNSQVPIIYKIITDKKCMKKPLKRSIHKVAKYQAFDFGALKKKPKTDASHNKEHIKSSLPNIPSPDNVPSCSDLTWASETSRTTANTVDSKSESVGSCVDSNSKPSLSLENFSSGTSSSDSKSSNTFSPQNDVLESSFNLDQVLDDLLLNETEDLTQGIENDWLESLLQ